MDACTPFEWKSKPQPVLMDDSMIDKVRDRWKEYGFTNKPAF
jgi:4-hydroxy-3-polyprenylbenzoate decarboxylase